MWENDYLYDINGNMTKDLNKGITKIEYNHLNLPTLVEINGPFFMDSAHNGTIEYVYDAVGTKLEKRVTELYSKSILSVVTTRYANGFVYLKNGNLAQPFKFSFFSQPEGYVEHDGQDYDYVYQYKDIVGNIRIAYKDSNNDGSVNSSEILEENNYYPFGLKMRGFNNIVSANNNVTASKNWTFQGQKYDDELGLNWYSFKYRNYDASLARFHNIDPLAEMFHYQSPYNFSENRVIDGIELEGLEYVSANKVRVFLKPNGDAALKMQNMTDATRIPFNQANSDTSTWSSDNIGNSNLNTTIGSVQTNLSSKYEAIRGTITQQQKIQPPIAKSTGQPDKRFTKERTVGGGNLIGAKEGRAAKGLLVIEGMKLGGKGIAFLMQLYDKHQTNKHLGFLNLAIDDVTQAYNDGLVTNKAFMNSESFYDLVNVVLYGKSTSGNEALETLGLSIYNHYNPKVEESETVEALNNYLDGISNDQENNQKGN